MQKKKKKQNFKNTFKRMAANGRRQLIRQEFKRIIEQGEIRNIDDAIYLYMGLSAMEKRIAGIIQLYLAGKMLHKTPQQIVDNLRKNIKR